MIGPIFLQLIARYPWRPHAASAGVLVTDAPCNNLLKLYSCSFFGWWAGVSPDACIPCLMMTSSDIPPAAVWSLRRTRHFHTHAEPAKTGFQSPEDDELANLLLMNSLFFNTFIYPNATSTKQS